MVTGLLSAAAILLMLLLVVIGVNENVLQFIGNIGQNLPFVGSWLNAISAFSRQTLDGSFQGSFLTALRVLLNCISSNTIDSILLGLLDAVANQFLLMWKKSVSRVLSIGETIVISLLGVLMLYYLKKTGDSGYAIFASIGSLGLLFLGIGILLRGQLPMLNYAMFMIGVIAGVFEAISGIGLICSLLLIPSMLKTGITAAGLLVWVLCLLGLIVASRLVIYAKKQMFA